MDTLLFTNISNNVNHKLAALLAPKAVHHMDLRFNRKFNKPLCKTNRFKNSFILSHCKRNFHFFLFGTFLIYYTLLYFKFSIYL